MLLVRNAWYAQGMRCWMPEAAKHCVSGLTPFPYRLLVLSYAENVCRVGQNPVYTVYMRRSLQGIHQIYSHVRRKYTVLANPKIFAPSTCMKHKLLQNLKKSSTIQVCTTSCHRRRKLQPCPSGFKACPLGFEACMRAKQSA
jgi:hypothetical protein